MPFNLNTILDKTPYGGFRAGMADQDAIYQSNSGLANDAIHRSKIAQDMETVQLKRPLDAVEQALKQRDAELGIREHDEGKVAADRDRKRAMDEADLTTKTESNKAKSLEQKIKGIQAAGQIFGPDANPGNMAMSWGTAQAAAKEYGFDLGEYNEQNAAKFLRMKEQTPMAMKLYEHLVEQKQKLDYDLISEQAKSQWRSAEEREKEKFTGGQNDLNRANNRAVASIHASNRGGGSDDPNTWTKQKAAAINAFNTFEETGEPPTEAQLLLLENEFVTKPLESALFRNPAFANARAKQMVPATQEQGLQEEMALRQQARTQLPAADAIDRARKAKIAKGEAKAAPSAPKGMGGGTGALFSGGAKAAPAPTTTTAASTVMPSERKKALLDKYTKKKD